MKFLLLLLCLLISPLLHAEKITIGTLPYDPPFEMAADKHDHFYGFDIDLMQEICKRAELDCQFKSMNFEQLFTELLAGKITLAIGAISITEQRQETFLFSLPYLASGGQFMALTNTPLTAVEGIRNKRVGVERGTLFKALVLEKFHNLVNVIDYATQEELLSALNNKNVDVILLDTGSAKYWVANNGSLFKLVGSSMEIGVGYGIMANKNQTDLINRVNRALLGMENDGSYLRIYSRYFSQMAL